MSRKIIVSDSHKQDAGIIPKTQICSALTAVVDIHPLALQQLQSHLSPFLSLFVSPWHLRKHIPGPLSDSFKAAGAAQTPRQWLLSAASTLEACLTIRYTFANCKSGPSNPTEKHFTFKVTSVLADHLKDVRQKNHRFLTRNKNSSFCCGTL